MEKDIVLQYQKLDTSYYITDSSSNIIISLNKYQYLSDIQVPYFSGHLWLPPSLDLGSISGGYNYDLPVPDLNYRVQIFYIKLYMKYI